MTRPRVLVTGLGVTSAAGCTRDGFWRSIVDGRPAVGPIRRFDASKYPARIAAEIEDAEWGGAGSLDPRWHAQGRIAWFAASAAREALADAGLPGRFDHPRAGIAVAAGMGRYGHREVFRAIAGRADEPDDAALAGRLLAEYEPAALDRRTPGSIAAGLAAAHGAEGPVLAVMTACAGGTQAIGDAARWIRQGRADVVLAGGADSEIYPMGLASFCLLGALSTRNDAPATASRPFDRDRDGFVLGEGAAMLVLESEAHAAARGATLYAEVAGFGSACDAWRVTDPHPDGLGAVLAMRRALADASETADTVDYVNAHGTSTVANDRIETRAIRAVLGRRAAEVPVSSLKSMIGHATVAAGAIEAVATALSLYYGVIPPTINLDRPDDDCDLDYVPHRARQSPLRVALSNSFAFGGQAAVLAMRRATA